MKKVSEFTEKDLCRAKRKYRIMSRNGFYFYPQVRKWFKWYFISTIHDGFHLNKNIIDGDRFKNKDAAVKTLVDFEACSSCKVEYIYHKK